MEYNANFDFEEDELNDYPYDDRDWDDEEEDPYSPTDWSRDPFETDEDYEERIQDLEDFADYYSD